MEYVELVNILPTVRLNFYKILKSLWWVNINVTALLNFKLLIIKKSTLQIWIYPFEGDPLNLILKTKFYDYVIDYLLYLFRQNFRLVIGNIFATTDLKLWNS
jgi:hypothetical protein